MRDKKIILISLALILLTSWLVSAANRVADQNNSRDLCRISFR